MLVSKDIPKSDIYYHIYKHLSTVNDWGVMDMDLRVFGKLLYEYKELHLRYTEEIIDRIFLDKNMKTRFIKELDTTYHSLMNSVTRLKKLGLLTDKNLINPKWITPINTGPNIIFTIQFHLV